MFALVATRSALRRLRSMGPCWLHNIRRRAALSSGILVLFAVGGSGPLQAASYVQNPDFFGINAQYVFKLPEDQWEPQLAAIARTGVGVVREDALWSAVEPRPPVDGRHHYDWATPDAIVTALARQGLRWYPILDYSTSWDGTLPGILGWKSAPRNPSYFAAYAAAFAHRYGIGGYFWSANPSLRAFPVQTYEIWNEPNRSDFWPNTRGAADRYGDLLATTASAVYAVNHSAKVIVGGLAITNLTEFLNDIDIRHPGLIAKMSAVAFHPYGANFAITGKRVRALRKWLDQHNASTMPIEITETGWAAPPLPENARSVLMSALIEGMALSSCEISRIIPYTWLTFENNPANFQEYYGIANLNITLKPAGVALVSAIEAVRHGTAIASTDPCAGLSKSPQASA